VLINQGLLAGFHEGQHDPMVKPHVGYSDVVQLRWLRLLNGTDCYVSIRWKNFCSCLICVCTWPKL